MSAQQVSKSDLIEAIALNSGADRGTAETCVNTMLAAMINLSIGQKLILRGFGTFEVKHKPGRTARNPQTGLPVEVPARDVLTFKPAKAKA